jgi:hypothetical protein
MSNEMIGKYLLKLREKTIEGQNRFVEAYKIGDEIGLLDKIQTNHIVEVLLKDGYLIIGKEHSKIKLSNEGYKRLESVVE